MTWTTPLPTPGGDTDEWGAQNNAVHTETRAAVDDINTALAELPESYAPLANDWTDGLAGAVERSLTSKTSDIVSVRDFGAVGDGTTDDTAAIQAAINSASGGYLHFPCPPVAYKVTAPLVVGQSTIRNFVGDQAKINYSGAGYCFQAIASDPTSIPTFITFMSFDGLIIGGGSNTNSDGAFHLQGCANVHFGDVTVQAFGKSTAIGLLIEDSFSIRASGILFIQTTPTCVKLGGSSTQVTNIAFRNFLWQPAAGGTGLSIATGILAGGLSLGNGGIRVSAGGTAIDWTGQYAGVHFGPDFHIESYDAAGSNSTTGIYLHGGSSLLCGSLKVEGVDFYNIKTLMHFDSSGGGSVQAVTIGTFYAVGLAGLAGTVFNLNVTSAVNLLGQPNVNSGIYTTFLTATSTGQFLRSPFITSSLPTAEISRQGQLVTIINANGDQSYVCQRNSAGTYVWAPLLSNPSVLSKTGNYTTSSADRGVLATGSTSWTLTLNTKINGQEVTVRNNGTGTVTVAASSGTVNGSTSLTAGQHAIYQCDGTNWNQIG